jgi:hypothetical protein
MDNEARGAIRGHFGGCDVGNKYDRKIWDKYEDRHAVVDVYRVLDAFDVRCPATAHAVKKLLCAGIRGHKDMEQDLAEAAQSIEEARAMVRQKRRSTEGGAANGQ